ncbi:hypothetical protein [Paenibacillus pseudetheri]|uniref:hypothetical protein n=1 Tax=Paenibacillus pseudetheri TaxID=2897682 RepID=UPI001F223AA1|nr:hypothetical protein [Paenibacillus pseudetheri]
MGQELKEETRDYTSLRAQVLVYLSLADTVTVFNWSPSTDNAGVTEYSLYRDGV